MCHPGFQPLSCERQAASLSSGHRPPLHKSQQAGDLFAGQAGRSTGLARWEIRLPGSVASMVEHIKVGS